MVCKDSKYFLAFVHIAASLNTVAAVSPEFPLYKQCDERWGSQEMGVDGPGERNTICHEGCAMSSVAMALAGYGLALPGETSPPTPGSLNAWLVANKGYVCAGGDCNNLVLASPDVISGGKMRLVGEWGGRCCGGDSAKPPASVLQEYLASPGDHHMVFIAHVRNSSHFVLLKSWNSSSGDFMVNDPGFDRNRYSYDEMSDVLMYSVFPSPTAIVPKRYPLFQQFDYRWKDDVIVTKTVGAVGCLMSSASMALNGHGITISGKASNPGALNAWLRNNKGYVSGDNFAEAALPKLDPTHVSWSDTSGMHRTNDIPLASVKASIVAGQPVIANVMKGEHFVLVVGFEEHADDTTLYVNDPGFYRVAYDYKDDVVGWRLFNMTEANTSNKLPLSAQLVIV